MLPTRPFGEFGELVDGKYCVAICHAKVNQQSYARGIFQIVFYFQSPRGSFIRRAAVSSRDKVLW